jgi:hypothetical protein
MGSLIDNFSFFRLTAIQFFPHVVVPSFIVLFMVPSFIALFMVRSFMVRCFIVSLDDFLSLC